MLNVREEDVRQVVQSGLQEHLQLEYKSELYTDADRGRRELLLDIAMFANTAGGILLLGIPEMRDEQGQPTGIPDPASDIGIETLNPEAVLARYDARVMEAVEERLPLESAPIRVADRRYVLAIRVPNSTRRPHSVRHEGHIYFPARRERQRYPMNVREIKELAMRTASRLQEAKEILNSAFLEVPRTTDLPYLITGIVPVFWDDFLIDIRRGDVRGAMTNFSRGSQQDYQQPLFTFHGLERHAQSYDHRVILRRNGLLTASSQLPLLEGQRSIGNYAVNIATANHLLRNFVGRAATVYEAAGIGGPFVIGMTLRTPVALFAAHPEGLPVLTGFTEPITPGDYKFPCLEVDEVPGPDAAIRPICDLTYQLFGLAASPNFDAAGAWVGR